MQEIRGTVSKGNILIGVVLVSILALSACSRSESGQAGGITEGVKAREFSLQTLDGDQVSLRDYDGSVVLVNFWATWCEPCRNEIPDLESAYQEHRDEGFVVLGVDVQEPADTVENFVTDMGITYPILLDTDGQVLKEYRLGGLPMSLILDRGGMIKARCLGSLSADQLQTYLKQVLP
jgi:cytochrome c biogenesis protein CcmG/thiol:disulfide interchange protein DsbE